MIVGHILPCAMEAEILAVCVYIVAHARDILLALRAKVATGKIG